MFSKIRETWYSFFRREEWENKEAALKHAIVDINATFDKVEAERDCYRDALAQYADTQNWSYYSFETKDLEYIGSDLARAALEQGEKIREKP